jgi:hypothetical protein|tara:strand:+ start:992 stop:1183 length:192 start_codon:yes stop_codon:yes gene_type:complete
MWQLWQFLIAESRGNLIVNLDEERRFATARLRQKKSFRTLFELKTNLLMEPWAASVRSKQKSK